MATLSEPTRSLAAGLQATRPARTLSPTTLDEALHALASGSPRILAGGTDLYAAHAERPVRDDLLDLTRLGELKGLARTETGWRIGAGATWTDVAAADLPPAFDALKAAARQVGSVQIQNTATLAGNLCNASPAADGVPALLALDASVELASVGGRRILALGDFLIAPRRTALRPGEMVSAILVPDPPSPSASAFEKLGGRRYLVISIAMVAVVLGAREGSVSHARIAVGACSPVARRLTVLEADLAGRPLADVAQVARAAHLDPLSPIDDVRAPAAYRRESALILVRRALTRAAASLTT